jgi:hypothetical protein
MFAFFAAVLSPSVHANLRTFANSAIPSVSIMLANLFALAIFAGRLHLPVRTAAPWPANLATVLHLCMHAAHAAVFAAVALFSVRTNFAAAAVLALRFVPTVHTYAAAATLFATTSEFAVLTNASTATLFAKTSDPAVFTNAATLALFAQVPRLVVSTISSAAAALPAT